VITTYARHIKNVVCRSDKTRRKNRDDDKAESQGKRKRDTDGKHKKRKTKRVAESVSDAEHDPERESDTDPEEEGMTDIQLADMLAEKSAASAAPSTESAKRQPTLAEINALLASVHDDHQ